ncbi:MAG: Fis family transcriptional regulator [Chloroflexota bacterium]|nr:MAG: Fis family transcriptional regulator [Chloroflexota bacterium]
MNTEHLGSSFDDFLAEEGLSPEVNIVAIKRAIAWQIERLMRERELSKAQLAKEMKTSRAAVDRLLDPTNESVTLQTLERAALALGKHLHVQFI